MTLMSAMKTLEENVEQIQTAQILLAHLAVFAKMVLKEIQVRKNMSHSFFLLFNMINNITLYKFLDVQTSMNVKLRTSALRRSIVLTLLLHTSAFPWREKMRWLLLVVRATRKKCLS